MPEWQRGAPTAADTAPARLSFVWTDTALALITKYQQNPLRAARALALLHAAMHDALVLAGGGRDETPAAWIAVDRAASLVLGHLYPAEPAGRLEAMGVAAAVATAHRTQPEPELADAAWRIGGEVAQRAIDRARRDGADRVWPISKRPAPAPGRWRAAPPLNVHDPAEPLAGEWRTWVLKDGAELEPPPPLPVDGARYDAEVREVKAVAERLSAAQKAIADEWNLDRGTVTPAGVWNLKAKALAEQQGLRGAETLRMLAALNVAMTDALIACWRAKFKWWTERPVTAIRERYDAAFLSYLITPAFPSYVSGHSTVSGAAERVLARFFPAQADLLRAQSEAAAESRLLGGIHFRSDNDEGLHLGRKIGERVVARALGGSASRSPAQ